MKFAVALDAKEDNTIGNRIKRAAYDNQDAIYTEDTHRNLLCSQSRYQGMLA
jgi:hypothetical protein